eukprot:ctg_181.g75
MWGECGGEVSTVDVVDDSDASVVWVPSAERETPIAAEVRRRRSAWDDHDTDRSVEAWTPLAAVMGREVLGDARAGAGAGAPEGGFAEEAVGASDTEMEQCPAVRHPAPGCAHIPAAASVTGRAGGRGAPGPNRISRAGAGGMGGRVPRASDEASAKTPSHPRPWPVDAPDAANVGPRACATAATTPHRSALLAVVARYRRAHQRYRRGPRFSAILR